MKKIRTLLTLLVVSICAVQNAWARVAPTIPEGKTLENGNTYYLYNVGSDRFLTNNNGYIYVLTDKGTPVKISAVNGTEYSIQFTNNNRYLYQGFAGNRTGESGISDPSSEVCRFTFTETDNGYLIQRVYDSVETEYLGYNGNENNYLYSNLTDGNIVWQLVDAEEAARFIAKRNLYRALEAAEGYCIDEWEAVYDNDGSTNNALQDAADLLNGGLTATAKITVPDWSDYKVLFYIEDISNQWYYGGSFQAKDITNGSSPMLKANVEVDDAATLAFNYERRSLGILEVYLDDELQFTVNSEEGNQNQRFFVEMAPGKHHITWKYINTNTSYSGSCYIRNIGVEQTPTIVVSLKEPGSLGSEVLAQTEHIKNVRKLIISGEMNADDWTQILNMNSIFSLDLTDAVITEIPDRQLSYNSHSDSYAFLHIVKLPTTLKTIGSEAFRGTLLDEMTFPEGLETIGDYAFSYTRIREAILPASLTKFKTNNNGSGYAFADNQSLTTISFPASVVTIPSGTFNECNHLQPFQIPEGITTIGNSAFQGCWEFDTAIPTTVTSIGSSGFRATGLSSVVIGENVTMKDYAFANCGHLTTAEFPTTMYDEIYYLLATCGNLRDVTFKSPTMVKSSKRNIFDDNNMSDITLHVPNYLVNTYKQDSYWYNCNVVGFSTADIQDWIVCQPLKLSFGQRFEGTPNVKVQGAGTWEIKGDDAMTLNNFETNFYNDNNGFVENKTSQVLSTCDNITITGDYTHHYYTVKNKWYFVTLPFDMKVGDIACPSSFAIRYYDGANRAVNATGGNWKNYAKDDVIPAGTGFIFQTSKDVWTNFKAQDNESKQRVFSNEIIATNLQVNASEQKEHKGWNLVGNPWMSYYNIHKMNFTAPITTWNPYYGTYTAYSIFDDDYAIKPNEAFFVQCPSNELTIIEFPVDGRQLTSVIESQNASRRLGEESRKLVDIELTNGETTDKTRFVLNPLAKMDYETTCDASKFFSMDNSVPQIYTIENGVALAINERPAGDNVVTIGVMIPANGTYTIKSDRNAFRKAIIVDKQNGTEFVLSTDGYTFSAGAGTIENRFELHLSAAETTGIADSMQTTDNGQQSFFNLNGQRVSAPQKGINIVNGKKVIIK